MDSKYNFTRLQPTVSSPASREHWDSSFNHDEPRKAQNSMHRNSIITGERRNRRSKTTCGDTGVFLRLLRHSKKRRRLSSYIGFEESKQDFKIPTLSYAAAGGCSADSRATRLDGESRFKGRVFSRTYRAPTPLFPAIPVRRKDIPIQGAPIRAILSPKGVFQNRSDRSCTLATKGHLRASIPRRLAVVCREPFKIDRQLATTVKSRCESGICGQSGQMPVYAGAKHSISRGSVKLSRNDGISYKDKSSKHFEPDNRDETRQTGEISHPVTTSGHAGCSDTCDQVGYAVPKTNSALADGQTPVSKNSEVHTGESDAHCSTGTTALAQHGVPSSRGSYGSTPGEEGNCYHRCESAGLGRSMETERSERNLGRGAPFSAYQLSRVESSVPNATIFSESADPRTCVNTVGQYVSSIQYKSSGGHEITEAATGCARALVMGRYTSSLIEGSSHSGADEHGSGCSVTEHSAVRRMATPPRDNSVNLEHIWHGSGGSVCRQSVGCLSKVFLFEEGDGVSRTGCISPQLAEWSPICISPISPDLVSSQSYSCNEPTAIINSPVLAEQTVVSSPSTSLNWSSSPVAVQPRSFDTAEWQTTARPTSNSEIVRLAVGGDPSLLVCSQGVRDTNINARAPSTRAQYQNRWKLFSRWCSENQINPQSCTITNILEFLQTFLTLGRSYSTIKVYVAALSAHRGLIDGISVGTHKLVVAFLRGVNRLNPPCRIMIPQWDLNIVLESLCTLPFEPLSTADIKWLSLKTAFLLAISSAKRVSELHALWVASQCLKWGPEDSKVMLWPNPAFLPKVLSSNFANTPLILPAFHSVRGMNQELCPVRSLRLYVDRTASWRTTDQLFVCFADRSKGSPLSKGRLAHWITEVITCSYVSAHRVLPDPVKCHSTRSVATSWAALRGVQLADICGAATWASPSTFSRFYRLNVVDAPNNCAIAVLGEEASLRMGSCTSGDNH